MAHKSDVEAQAFKAGQDAGRNAASWVCDGNTSQAAIRKMLRMIEDGDPALDLRWPNLSGEYADDPTPLSLARELTGEEDPDPETIDAIAQAWEDGVSDTFESEVERVLRANLSDDAVRS